MSIIASIGEQYSLNTVCIRICLAGRSNNWWSYFEFSLIFTPSNHLFTNSQIWRAFRCLMESKSSIRWLSGSDTVHVHSITHSFEQLRWINLEPLSKRDFAYELLSKFPICNNTRPVDDFGEKKSVCKRGSELLIFDSIKSIFCILHGSSAWTSDFEFIGIVQWIELIAHPLITYQLEATAIPSLQNCR